MSALLPELFPGFETRFIEVNGINIHTRIGGSGPALLLLHGYPQTHAMWHTIAQQLAEKFTLVIADLPGYGQSDLPSRSNDHSNHSKRAFGNLMTAMMQKLGFNEFQICGHDRGGRVTYRMAFDHPQHVQRIAVLDIVPTYTVWHGFNKDEAIAVYHWAFLAQPYPFPEKMITANPRLHLEHTLANWTKSQDLSAFSEDALAHYRSVCADDKRINAWCEDYRAGATIDDQLDELDLKAGNKISCPVIALWGQTGIAEKLSSPLDAWKQYALDVSGEPVQAGHFIVEENPSQTLKLLFKYLD